MKRSEESETSRQAGKKSLSEEPMMDASKPSRRQILNLLDKIERLGNRLPHPATLFAILAGCVVVASFVASLSGLHATHPTTGRRVEVFNLLSRQGVQYLFVSVTKNFVEFPPLGIVLVAMIGIGVAEGSGLIGAMVRHAVTKAPKKLVTAAVVAAGVASHMASSVGYVVLVPLGAVVFIAVGRHPIAGLSAAFVGVSGGFGANFFISSVDPVLAGLTESAARIIDPTMRVNPAVNFYFMFASALLVVLVGTVITERIVEPRLPTYAADEAHLEHLNDKERKGLVWAGVSAIALFVVFALLTVPEDGLLHGPGDVLHGPFFKGLITAILLVFFVPGVVYGAVVGTIRSDHDLMAKIVAAMKGLAPYVVLVFFAAQFVAYFNKSNLGLILAIDGAKLIERSGISGPVLVVVFVLFSAAMNMFMGSASAKWAIMAPVFVPMFMLAGYHPALTQAAFRIGDSVTNIVTPMMSYFPLIVTFMQKYDEKAGIGTLIAIMLPYSLALFVGWSLLLVVWYALGIPLGPGGPLHFP